MYENHFGLRCRPFRATPDSECYYPATGHERALARLQQAVADDEGLALLTGDPGTGKTLLCHCLLDRLGPETTSVFLTNSHLGDRAGLLQAILYDLSLPYEGRSEQELRLTLTDVLLKNYAGGRRTILVVDEAQNLTPVLLEELRLLGNLEGRGGKALHVILVGQSNLVEKLRRPELAAISQRLAVREQVEPLTVDEAADYLLHHLRAAGARPEGVLSDEALEVLARGSRGVPRLLNQAAHQALVLAHSASAEQVDAEAALEALALLGLEESPAETEDAGPEYAPAGLIEELPAGMASPHQPEPSSEESAEAAATEPDLLGQTGRAHRLFKFTRRPA